MRIFPSLPPEIATKMVDLANAVRKNFMGNSTAHDAFDVTLSPRTLLRWAIPEDKADEIIKALCDICNEFMTAKAEFLATYDEAVRDWIEAHPNRVSLISSSTVSREYVESKLTFVCQRYRVAPAETIDEQSAQDFGLNSEIENLGNTLFREIAKDASDIWKNVFEGKTSVSQKALSPLRTMQTKLRGRVSV